MEIVRFAFGEELCNILAGEEYERLSAEHENQVVVHEFNTWDETVAYLQGVEDASGWLESMELGERDWEEVNERVLGGD